MSWILSSPLITSLPLFNGDVFESGVNVSERLDQVARDEMDGVLPAGVKGAIDGLGLWEMQSRNLDSRQKKAWRHAICILNANSLESGPTTGLSVELDATMAKYLMDAVTLAGLTDVLLAHSQTTWTCLTSDLPTLCKPRAHTGSKLETQIQKLEDWPTRVRSLAKSIKATLKWDANQALECPQELTSATDQSLWKAYRLFESTCNHSGSSTLHIENKQYPSSGNIASIMVDAANVSRRAIGDKTKASVTESTAVVHLSMYSILVLFNDWTPSSVPPGKDSLFHLVSSLGKHRPFEQQMVECFMWKAVLKDSGRVSKHVNVAILEAADFLADHDKQSFSQYFTFPEGPPKVFPLGQQANVTDGQQTQTEDNRTGISNPGDVAHAHVFRPAAEEDLVASAIRRTLFRNMVSAMNAPIAFGPQISPANPNISIRRLQIAEAPSASSSSALPAASSCLPLPAVSQLTPLVNESPSGPYLAPSSARQKYSSSNRSHWNTQASPLPPPLPSPSPMPKTGNSGHQEKVFVNPDRNMDQQPELHRFDNGVEGMECDKEHSVTGEAQAVGDGQGGGGFNQDDQSMEDVEGDTAEHIEYPSDPDVGHQETDEEEDESSSNNTDKEPLTKRFKGVSSKKPLVTASRSYERTGGTKEKAMSERLDSSIISAGKHKRKNNDYKPKTKALPTKSRSESAVTKDVWGVEEDDWTPPVQNPEIIVIKDDKLDGKNEVERASLGVTKCSGIPNIAGVNTGSSRNCTVRILTINVAWLVTFPI